MKLYVQNIAKIESAEVAVDGISVLAGYNATGKSTISKSLSGIIRAYTNIHQRAELSQFRSVDSVMDSFIEEIIPEESVFAYDNGSLIQDLLSRKTHLPTSYQSFQQLYLSYVPDLSEEFPKPSLEIEEHYQAFAGQMQKTLKRPVDEHIQFLVEASIRDAFDGQINTLGHSSIGSITLCSDNGAVICHTEWIGNRIVDCSYQNIKESLPIYLEPKHALDELPNNPANRYRSKRSREPLVNFLLAHDAANLENRTIEDQERSERVIAIINEAIRGGLVENGSSLQYMDEQFSLISLKNLASGNKTFAVIRRLLENGQFYKNHTLIIDEPEVNLHPAWQLTLANVLVILPKELGLKIFLNSHSPYFVRAVEVYSQRCEIADRCHFYQTRPGNHGMYQVVDVTGNTEQIFRDLYLPLEEL